MWPNEKPNCKKEEAIRQEAKQIKTPKNSARVNGTAGKVNWKRSSRKLQDCAKHQLSPYFGKHVTDLIMAASLTQMQDHSLVFIFIMLATGLENFCIILLWTLCPLSFSLWLVRLELCKASQKMGTKGTFATSLSVWAKWPLHWDNKLGRSLWSLSLVDSL